MLHNNYFLKAWWGSRGLCYKVTKMQGVSVLDVPLEQEMKLGSNAE